MLSLGVGLALVVAMQAPLDTAAIEAYVREEMRRARVPGLALAIVKDGSVAYLRGYGRADPSGRPVTPETPFILGSTSKSFTALAVMQLAEAGRIELDAPVVRYVPWFRVGADSAGSAGITVRQLLNQTSGIPQSAGLTGMLETDSSDAALERRVRMLRQSEIASPPGKVYAYSNANYSTLGLLVQTVSGMPYEAWIEQRVFAPLGMTRSFTSQARALPDGLATGHRWWFGFPVAVVVPWNRGDVPAGFLITSAADMARYLLAQLEGGRVGDSVVLSPEGIAELHRPAASTGRGRFYGMGWSNAIEHGLPVVEHEGATANFGSAMFLVPGQRLGVAVQVNAMAMLDAFASAAGVTSRRIALGVTSLAAGKPLPTDTGPGVGRVYLIVDLMLVLLTGLLALSLVWLPRWCRRLRARGVPTARALARQVARVAVLHLIWPLLLLVVLPARAAFPAWRVMALFQPDLTWWVGAAALLTLAKGTIELGMVGRVWWASRGSG